MKGLLSLSALIDRVNEVIGKAMGYAILLAVIVSAGNAVVRKVFSVSSNAWLELQWYLFGAAFMLAAAYTLKQNEHIRVDVFYASRTRRTQHWIDLFGHVVFLMPFVLLMTFMLIPYALRAYQTGEISTNAGGLLIWPARALLAAGFVLLTLQGLSEIVKKIAVMRGVIPDPTPFLTAKELAEMEAQALARDIKS